MAWEVSVGRIRRWLGLSSEDASNGGSDAIWAAFRVFVIGLVGLGVVIAALFIAQLPQPGAGAAGAGVVRWIQSNTVVVILAAGLIMYLLIDRLRLVFRELRAASQRDDEGRRPSTAARGFGGVFTAGVIALIAILIITSAMIWGRPQAEWPKILSYFYNNQLIVALIGAVVIYLTIDRLKEISDRMKATDDRIHGMTTSIDDEIEQHAKRYTEKFERKYNAIDRRLQKLQNEYPWLTSINELDLTIHVPSAIAVRENALAMIADGKFGLTHELLYEAANATDPGRALYGSPQDFADLAFLAEFFIGDNKLADRFLAKAQESARGFSVVWKARRLRLAVDRQDLLDARALAEDLERYVLPRLFSIFRSWFDSSYRIARRNGEYYAQLYRYYAAVGEEIDSALLLKQADKHLNLDERRWLNVVAARQLLSIGRPHESLATFADLARERIVQSGFAVEYLQALKGMEDWESAEDVFGALTRKDTIFSRKSTPLRSLLSKRGDKGQIIEAAVPSAPAANNPAQHDAGEKPQTPTLGLDRDGGVERSRP